jgi:hypothetical protein
MGHAAAIGLVNLMEDKPVQFPVLRAELQCRESTARVAGR